MRLFEKICTEKNIIFLSLKLEFMINNQNLSEKLCHIMKGNFLIPRKEKPIDRNLSKKKNRIFLVNRDNFFYKNLTFT